MTPNEAVELKKAIRRLVLAERADSWKKAGPPGDIEIIEETLRRKKARLASYISKLTERPQNGNPS